MNSISLNDAKVKAPIYEQRAMELEATLLLERNQNMIVKLHKERVNQTDQYEREVFTKECSSLQHQVKPKDDTIQHLKEELYKLRDSYIAKDKEYTRLKDKMDETEDQWLQMMRNTISSLSEDAFFSKWNRKL